MDYEKELDDLQTCLENFNTNVASELLSDTHFVTYHAGDIIPILGNGLTESNFNSRPDYFNFCEEQLLKMAQNEAHQENAFEFLELIEVEDCKLSSSVLIAVTVLENTENPNSVCLEYLLKYTFNNLNEIDDTRLKDILPIIIKHLMKLNKHFQNERPLLYYFARVAFLVLRAKIEPTEYIKILSDIINDPFYLLEQELEGIEENLYLASFYYLYFKTEMLWGPKIYNQFYILEKCSHLALSVVEDNNFGKSFTKLILSKYKDNEIPLYFLNKCHEEFFVEAAHSALFNDDLKVRKDSIELLMIYMDKLCCDAQYIVLKHIFLKPLDSCIKEQMIVKMKNLILSKLKLNQDLGYFQGVRLLELIELCCNIPDGPKCQVVKNKEHILSAITLLYLFYKSVDKRLNLDKGFSNFVKQFTKDVQSAIDYTNEQYEIESKRLDNKDFKDDKTEKIMNLPKFSKSEKREMLSQYNVTTTLIQSHLNLFDTINDK